MKIRLKLFATLRGYLGAETPSNEVELNVAEGASVQAVIDLQEIPSQRVHLVLVNGHHVPPQALGTTHLKAGDVLCLWPPVAGG
jgi:molybdopterin converting factor small subunit